MTSPRNKRDISDRNGRCRRKKSTTAVFLLAYPRSAIATPMSVAVMTLQLREKSSRLRRADFLAFVTGLMSSLEDVAVRNRQLAGFWGVLPICVVLRMILTKLWVIPEFLGQSHRCAWEPCGPVGYGYYYVEQYSSGPGALQ